VSQIAATVVPQLVAQCRYASLPEPTTEHRFHPVRRWKFDLAFVRERLAVEVEGGVFIQGRHTRGVGAEADIEKYAEAAILGWTVIRATPRQVRNGQALRWIERWLTQHRGGLRCSAR
jgi:very-short-patch-repair endonuclease